MNGNSSMRRYLLSVDAWSLLVRRLTTWYFHETPLGTKWDILRIYPVIWKIMELFSSGNRSLLALFIALPISQPSQVTASLYKSSQRLRQWTHPVQALTGPVGRNKCIRTGQSWSKNDVTPCHVHVKIIKQNGPEGWFITFDSILITANPFYRCWQGVSSIFHIVFQMKWSRDASDGNWHAAEHEASRCSWFRTHGGWNLTSWTGSLGKQEDGNMKHQPFTKIYCLTCGHTVDGKKSCTS